MRPPRLAIAVFAALMLVAAGSRAAEPLKIRVAWVVPVSNWATLLGEARPRVR